MKPAGYTCACNRRHGFNGYAVAQLAMGHELRHTCTNKKCGRVNYIYPVGFGSTVKVIPMPPAAAKKNPKRTKLRRCPFDGGEARLVKREGSLPYAVECRRCHASTGRFRLQHSAVEKWNGRA